MARYDRVLRSARSPTYAQPGHDEGMPRGEMVVSLHVTLAPSPCFALQLRITLQFSRVGTTQRTADCVHLSRVGRTDCRHEKITFALPKHSWRFLPTPPPLEPYLEPSPPPLPPTPLQAG